MSGLDNLRSIFEDELNEKVELFKSNQPVDKFDTKLNYNDNSSIDQSFTFSINTTQRGGRDNPLLDSLLRGRVYEPIRFSQDFQNNNLFVVPEKGEVENSLFRTQTFDPRSTTPKLDTLYFNTEKSFNPATNPTDFSTAIGNNDSPFTPLTSLGGQFKENLNWSNLYNREHTPKDNPTYKGINAINYGVNVNRDKLDIRDSETKSSLYDLSRKTLAGFGEGEPYIISNIALSEGVHSGGRLLNQGPIAGIPINRMVTDTLRIGKFLTSQKGLGFIAAQNFLGSNSKSVYIGKLTRNGEPRLLQARQRFKQTYNPLSTLLQTVGRAGFSPVGLVDKTEPGLSSLFGADEYGGDNSTNGEASFNETFTGGSTLGGFGFGDFVSGLTSAVLGQTGVPTTAKKTFKGDGDKMTLAPMIKGNTLGDINATGEDGFSNTDVLTFNIGDEKEGMPFYFKDMRDNTYIVFRAYIEGLTENISPSYASHNYVGRSEPVYVYERGEREISMTLKLVAQTKSELNKIYEKMNRLTSLCYPQYIDEGEDGYGNRMKPPLTKFRYGELFGETNKELRGYIKSVSYSVEQSSPYETEVGKRVPRHVTATIGYQVIHDKAPRLGTKFYGFIGE